MKLILNIGLEGVPLDGKSYTNGRENLRDVAAGLTVVRALRRNGFLLGRTRLDLTQGEEPTVVAQVLTGGGVGRVGAEAKIFALAAELNQDCIAVYSPATGEGSLIGPRAEKWGAFNPAFFKMTDGGTLAQEVVA